MQKSQHVNKTFRKIKGRKQSMKKYKKMFQN